MQALEALGGAGIGLPIDAAGENSPVAESSPSIMFSEAAAPDFLSMTEVRLDDADSSAETSVEAPDDSKAPEALVLEQSVDADLPVAELEVVEFAAADEAPPEETTHELLDLDDFAIGASQPVSEDAPEPEPIAADSIDIEGLAAEPESTDNATETAREPETELAADVILGLSDDTPEPAAEAPVSEFEVEPTPVAGEDLTRAIDQLDGLETFSIDIPIEAPVSASDEAAPPEVPAPGDTFATETMAELYAQQGHLESAMEIYEQLLERTPDDAELRRRASDVERQLHGAPLAEVAAPVSAGPTIREFFRGLLGGRDAEGAAAATPAESTEPVGASPGVESEGSLDILFSEAPADDADISAAMSLAQAFSSEEDESGDALHGTPAHPATDELSLDHVFRTSTPAKGSAAAGAFSLDQFFAGELANDAPEGASEGGGAPPRSGEDIAQFNAWLNGLKKT